MSMLKLGVLDFCMLADGQTPGERLHETLELARVVEGLGYERYWLSEHHAHGVAHASPELLVPLILSQTTRLRAGPAGILLRHYSPFKVGDTFRCAEALYPGRVDVGIARGGTSPDTAAALLDGAADEAESYTRKVADVVGHLRGTLPDGHPHANATSVPQQVDPPQIWVLASGTQSAPLAARLGSALSLGLFLEGAATSATPAIVEEYRSSFVPCPAMPRPRTNIAVAGICADTFDDAVRILHGHRNRFIVPNVFGTADLCWERLEHLADLYQVDEIVFAALGSTLKERLRAYQLLAAERAARGPAPRLTWATGLPASA
jgi:luciferase family oxidoreductase group 1